MKKSLIIGIILGVLATGLAVSTASAAISKEAIRSTGYIPLMVPIPFPGCQSSAAYFCDGNQIVGVQDFAVFVSVIFQFAIVFLSIILVGIIVIGGALYIISGGDPKRVEQGKSFIKNGFFSLIVLLFSVVILNEINPQLITPSTSISPASCGALSSQPECDAGLECRWVACPQINNQSDCQSASGCAWNAQTEVCSSAPAQGQAESTVGLCKSSLSVCDAYINQTDCEAQLECFWSGSACLDPSTVDCLEITIESACESRGDACQWLSQTDRCVTSHPSTAADCSAVDEPIGCSFLIGCVWEEDPSAIFGGGNCIEQAQAYNKDCSDFSSQSTCPPVGCYWNREGRSRGSAASCEFTVPPGGTCSSNEMCGSSFYCGKESLTCKKKLGGGEYCSSVEGAIGDIIDNDGVCLSDDCRTLVDGSCSYGDYSPEDDEDLPPEEE